MTVTARPRCAISSLASAGASAASRPVQRRRSERVSAEIFLAQTAPRAVHVDAVHARRTARSALTPFAWLPMYCVVALNAGSRPALRLHADLHARLGRVGYA